MKAHEKITKLQNKLKSRGIDIDYQYIYKLRLAEMRLHRWCENECGNGDNYKSWAIERDETTTEEALKDNKLESIEANCNLIAAAPELLEALKKCVLVIEREGIENVFLDEARRLIDKTTPS